LAWPARRGATSGGCWTRPRSPAAPSRETVKRSQLAGWAGYGWDASHHRFYWGLKLYVLAAPDARTHFERDLEITKATLGPDHPYIVIFRDNLDHALQQLGGE